MTNLVIIGQLHGKTQMVTGVINALVQKNMLITLLRPWLSSIARG